MFTKHSLGLELFNESSKLGCSQYLMRFGGNLQCATEQVTGMHMEVQEFVDV